MLPLRLLAPDGQRGYTLIEVLVVLTIMGILMSVVLPYLPGDKQDVLYDELDRFESRLAYAQTHAVLQSQDLGLSVEDGEYRFMQRAQSGWEVIEEEPLQTQSIPDFLSHQLFIEGVEVFTEEPVDDEIPAPKVILFSSGEVTPFSYLLALTEQAYSTLTYDPLGEVVREDFFEVE